MLGEVEVEKVTSAIGLGAVAEKETDADDSVLQDDDLETQPIIERNDSASSEKSGHYMADTVPEQP